MLEPFWISPPEPLMAPDNVVAELPFGSNVATPFRVMALVRVALLVAACSTVPPARVSVPEPNEWLLVKASVPALSVTPPLKPVLLPVMVSVPAPVFVRTPVLEMDPASVKP